MSAVARAVQTERAEGHAALWSVVVTVVIAMIGWSFMLGSRLSAVETEAVQAKNRLERVERDASEGARYLQSIDQRLARIEGALGAGKR